jgi:hypothetical protein
MDNLITKLVLGIALIIAVGMWLKAFTRLAGLQAIAITELVLTAMHLWDGDFHLAGLAGAAAVMYVVLWLRARTAKGQVA